MELVKAKELALQKMHEHGLINNGWYFEFDNAKQRFGCCHTSDKKITLSKYLTELNSETEILDTILHEIAHALTPNDISHGWYWQMKAIEIGCKPNRCYDDNAIKTPEPNFITICDNCGKETKRFRVRKNVACGECCNKYNGGKYSAKYILRKVKLTWHPAQ